MFLARVGGASTNEGRGMSRIRVGCAAGAIAMGAAMLSPAAFAGGAQSRESHYRACMELVFLEVGNGCKRWRRTKKDPSFSQEDCVRTQFQKAKDDPNVCKRS